MITQRIDNITLIPAHYRTAMPPCPPSVKIELTARCDLACFFAPPASAYATSATWTGISWCG